MSRALLGLALAGATISEASAAEVIAATTTNTALPWAAFVEPEFPYFSSVLDLRGAGSNWPTNNLTPRALILRAGDECWVGFDLDLLRVAAVWRGRGVTPVSMAQGSYHEAGLKAPEGQDRLPNPDGPLALANGLYPGWQLGAGAATEDPRDRGVDPLELGRGPLPVALGRFEAVRRADRGARLEYQVSSVRVEEAFQVRTNARQLVLERRLDVAPHDAPLALVVGQTFDGRRPHVTQSAGSAPDWEPRRDALHVLRVPPSTTAVTLRLDIHLPEPLPETKDAAAGNVTSPAPSGGRRWPAEVRTAAVLAPSTNAFVVDRVALPTTNPWRRNVRLADLTFLDDRGNAAAVTFDGDVWVIAGLLGDLSAVTWRRFASGLHEPLGVAAAPDGIYVHDRNGVWHLRDLDGDGEAEEQTLFCNAFTQTAETREFAAGLRRAPDGSFVIAKGGQEGNTVGRHNGSVLRISADGQSVTVLGHGFRQPFLGVHPVTGLVTVSDQQGHYVPATPLHFLSGDAFHGFVPLVRPRDQYPEPITEPLLWIPHPINPSGAGQVWLAGARMGPLSEQLVHLGYYRPEVFVVARDDADGGARPGAAPRQAAVVSLTRDLEFAPLAGAVNPADGQLYITGFQIWGSVAPQISGLARVRFTGLPYRLPVSVVPWAEGLELRFAVPLAASAAKNLANYSIERWQYRRSSEYGSPHFRRDGSKGQEVLLPSSAYLARDGRAVFLGVPGMETIMQMRLGWSLVGEDGVALAENAYFTPNLLRKFEPTARGFEDLTVDLTPRPAVLAAAPSVASVPSAEEGRRLSELMGCVACHSIDGSVIGKVGPSWKGILGKERVFADGTSRVADEAYLFESIREPSKRVVRGFEKTDTGMPSYEGVLTEPQIASLVRYLKSL